MKEVRLEDNPSDVGYFGGILFIMGFLALCFTGFLTFCGLVAPDSWAHMVGVFGMIIGGCLAWTTV